MADCPGYYTKISLIISRVMNDVGVNKNSVLKRRRANLLTENIDTLSRQDFTRYIFGSQTEGTTTIGLKSDTDVLCSFESINVIQDWKDWQHGKTSLLMLRDERLYPGYCKLQCLYSDVPLPVRENDCPVGESWVVDSEGNVIFKEFNYVSPGTVRHGPAETIQGGVDLDSVPALRCQTWPLHYKQWAPSRRRDWPTSEMIQHMKSTGCFIVKAAHRLDQREETWRISTSLAERCLMFSLNITQIRSYVLLKMIVKTFIQPHLPDTISSYMCKTLMFHCIENTRKEFWKEHNLLQSVHLVLLYMIAAVLDENCPNYFNKAANLFLGKVDVRNKMGLLHILRSLLKSRGRFLLYIYMDNINSRLMTYIGLSCGTRNFVLPQNELERIRYNQCAGMCSFFWNIIARFPHAVRLGMDLTKTIASISQITLVSTTRKVQRKAALLCLPFICSLIGSVEASKSILRNTQVNPLTLKLFDLSLNSDVSSSRLKFASYLYCTGQLERTLSVLQDVEERMTDSVMMICGCHCPKYPPGFLEREASQKYQTTDSLALCVMFSMAESQCCPRELQFELYRSTGGERRNRRAIADDWMDLVVMDSLPYLFYLQYMTYRHIGQHNQQYTALNKLSECVRNNKYLTHRETAYNVLGQCMEYEGLLEDAIECYRISLRIRPNNNTVRWHIMRL